ncbi:hypothetical protein INR49_003030 [Caranx melampygus]|nr:hypothetical protein INR49_003030 [Caranx melampygus]
MLADMAPNMNIPRIQVFCDESQLTVLVDKRSYGVVLTAEEIQLGHGCYSNREQPNQFVFTYSVNECGTAYVEENGLKMFKNSLHLNLRKPLTWKTPSTVDISCFPKRYYNSGIFTSVAPPESGTSFDIKAMNPSWTSAAESNVYERGQVINLQVSAKTRPNQQLFIQSCFVSTSPEPQIKPRHALIMNKGCTAPLGSPHLIVQFVASSRGDVVNFVLNTSYLISELYIHCSVLISDQDAKATVSTGLLVIVDKLSPEPDVSGPQSTTPVHLTNSMLSGAAVLDNTIVSGTSLSRGKFSSPPQGVVVVSQDPVGTLTLWLPGQVQDTDQGNNIGSKSEDSLPVELAVDLPVPQPPSTDQESSHLNPPTNEIIIPVTAVMTLDDLNQIDFKQMGDELAQMPVNAAVTPQDGTNGVLPVIRSKIQFSKGLDGSQTLSYEEDVIKPQEVKGGIRRCGMNLLKRKEEPRPRGLHSVFLDLLRRMDKAE